ncbi:MAG: hypothetical protein WB473_05170 [Pedococcus sp.]
MSEPSTNIPGEVADDQVEQPSTEAPATDSAVTPEKVELELDEDKLEAWDEVKSDYQVDPAAEDTPVGIDPEGMDEGDAPG